MGLIRPTLETLDTRVSETRSAQEDLHAHITVLEADLDRILEQSGRGSVDLESAVEKLNNAKRRVVVVANLLQGAQVGIDLYTQLH